MTMGEKIREARKAKGYTQKQLAQLINVKNTSVSNWESDLNKPDADTITKLCNTLDVSANYLLGWVHEAEDDFISDELLLTPRAIRKLRELSLIHSRKKPLTLVDIVSRMITHYKFSEALARIASFRSLTDEDWEKQLNLVNELFYRDSRSATIKEVQDIQKKKIMQLFEKIVNTLLYGDIPHRPISERVKASNQYLSDSYKQMDIASDGTDINVLSEKP